MILCRGVVAHQVVGKAAVRRDRRDLRARGLRLVELTNGDVLTLSVSNSTTDDQPRAWLHRYDASVQSLWQATLADEPLLQPVDAVEHGNGLITVLGMPMLRAWCDGRT